MKLRRQVKVWYRNLHAPTAEQELDLLLVGEVRCRPDDSELRITCLQFNLHLFEAVHTPSNQNDHPPPV